MSAELQTSVELQKKETIDTDCSEWQMWAMWPPRRGESARVACSAVGTDLLYVMSVHMFLLCRVKSAMTKTLSVCLCSSHVLANEPSIFPS